MCVGIKLVSEAFVRFYSFIYFVFAIAKFFSAAGSALPKLQCFGETLDQL